jgi:tryptophanyl-tRNA synthetase
MSKKIILTGDRPTGPLHLGHYLGSLKNRVDLQHTHEQYVMIADVQALTDNYATPEKVHKNVLEVAYDYLAVGLDPAISTIFIQSLIPEIAELAIYYMNFVTISRLRRNPTVKMEMVQKGYDEQVTVGFLSYPIHQAADITAFGAEVVPVGEDQLPILEQAHEIVRAFNRTYHTDALVEPKALLSPHARLPGVDGKAKMSKSLGNAIYLSDSDEAIARKVRSMYTDSGHLRISDPGKVEGNTVFMYLDIFDPHKEEIAALKEHYQKGGLGDMVLKTRLTQLLQALIGPMREKRNQVSQDPAAVMQMLKESSAKAREKAAQTLTRVKEAMKLNY